MYENRFNKELMWSSKDLEWRTPQELYEYLDGIFSFTLDPCTSEDNPLGTPKFYTPKEDGLAQSWRGEKAFLNPPYGREYPKWVKKAYEEVYEGQCVLAVLLLPARTDTKAFHNYCTRGEIWFLKGRLKFGDSKNSAPFPSMIVLFYKGVNLPPGSQILDDIPDGKFECKHCGCKLGFVVAMVSGHSLNPNSICKVCGRGQWSYILPYGQKVESVI